MKKEVQIKETYIDESGKMSERIKIIMVPTGKVIPVEDSHPVSSEENKE